MTQRGSRRTALAALLILLTVVIGLLVLGASYFVLWKPVRDAASTTRTPTPAALASRGVIDHTPMPTGTGDATRRSDALETLNILQQAEVPPRDLNAIVARLKLKSKTPIPRTTGKPPANYALGHVDTFFVHDIAAKNYYTIQARVHSVTDHAYWYVQEGESADEQALRETVDAFEERIYPTNTRIFGTEWKPGVDNDPRITVLLADIPNVGGYYSSADEYTRAINQFSNEREMLYINVGSGWEGIADTLAHEHQHMVHWHARPNHDVWLNEGSAVLAETLNGFSDVGVDESFMRDTDVQLNAWQQSPGESIRHYGAAYLFLEYLHSNYGGERMVRALVSAEGQGVEAVENALRQLGYTEKFTEVFGKWIVANLLDGERDAPQGLFYPDHEVSVSIQERVRTFPGTIEGSVAQFGADYIEISQAAGGDSVTLHFDALPYIPLIGTERAASDGFWWSNRGDVSNTHMTRSFDLRNLQQATLNFSAWYDIEGGFDYAYVEASTDGGVTWDTLKGRYTTTDNPNGTNLGNAYTGKSHSRDGADANGWLRESIDLAPYAGNEVRIRFEYITDDGYNAQGFTVDDIAIPEIDYADNAEGDSNWEAKGFARVSEELPQQFYLAAVLFGDGAPEVLAIPVGEDGKAAYKLEGLGSKYESAVLVVSAVTPHTLQRAEYKIEVVRNE